MNPTLERLTASFTELIGPAAFAKAEAAIAAAKAAEAAAAKAAAEKLAAPKPAAGAGLGEPGKALGATPPAPSQPTPALSPTTTTAAPARPVAAMAPRPATTPIPTLPVQATLHAAKGYDFDATVAPDQVVAAAQILDAAGFGLDAVTGVDWIAQNEMEVVYDYFHPTKPVRVVIRARVLRATPALPTISTVFPGANWHEREAHDFFGLEFVGHPNLKPFLLPEDANFHPLRKDYQP